MTILCFSLLSILLWPQAPRPVQPSQAAPLVVIDGATDPGSVPQYLVWQRAFLSLSARDQRPIVLSASDLALVFKTADEHQMRDAERQSQFQVASDLQKKQPGDGFVAFARRFELARRAATLAFADDLVDQLKGEGKNAFLAWLQDFRRSIKITIPETEIAFFRLPR